MSVLVGVGWIARLWMVVLEEGQWKGIGARMKGPECPPCRRQYRRRVKRDRCDLMTSHPVLETTLALVESTRLGT